MKYCKDFYLKLYSGVDMCRLEVMKGDLKKPDTVFNWTIVELIEHQAETGTWAYGSGNKLRYDLSVKIDSVMYGDTAGVIMRTLTRAFTLSKDYAYGMTKWSGTCLTSSPQIEGGYD